MLICCFTGPRPQSLPWGFNIYCFNHFKLRHLLKKNIILSIKQGYTYFISGMALGVDLMAAEIIIKLKRKYNILLECAIPCKNQTVTWKDDFKEKYMQILKQADKITYVSECNYFNGCMQKRNKYMVDISNRVIGVYNKNGGGTMQTLAYAYKTKKEVILIKPKFLR